MGLKRVMELEDCTAVILESTNIFILPPPLHFQRVCLSPPVVV